MRDMTPPNYTSAGKDDYSSEVDAQHMEIKGISLSLEEVKVIQLSCRYVVDGYITTPPTWEQRVAAVLLHERLESIKQYAKPI